MNPVYALLTAFMAVFLCAFSPAGSPVFSPAGSPVPSEAVVVEEEEEASCDCLADVIDSAIVELDATDSRSYSGTGQTWSNLIESPADGSAQTAYDFIRGSGVVETTADPTFNGSAGDAAAYWSFDGGDHFALKSVSNTTFLEALHKTTGGTDFWMAAAVTFGANTSAGLMSTGLSGSRGVAFRVNGSEQMLIQQQGDSAAVFSASTQTFTESGTALLIISYEAATGTLRRWINGVADHTTLAFNTSTGAATGTMVIGALRNGASSVTSQLPNASRLYHASMGNELLDDDKAAAITTHLCTRHNRNYTGSCL